MNTAARAAHSGPLLKRWATPPSCRRGAARISILTILIAPLIGWWLFADTYEHHRPTRSDASQPARAVIRFAHFGNYQDYQLWQSIIGRFEDRHSDFTVRQEYVVGLANHYNTKMRQQILAGDLPDVALIQLGPFHELAAHFADVSGVLDEDAQNVAWGSLPFGVLHPKAVRAFRVDGSQRGVPVSGGSLLIYLNVQCVDRAARHLGRPIELPNHDWTLADFRQLARDLTCDFDGDGRTDQFGFWLPRWIYFLPFVWSNGAAITDRSCTQWAFTGEAAERAITMYRQLAVDDGVCPRDDEVPQLFQDTGFLTGKVAMCVNGPWFLPFLAKTELANAFKVMPVPIGSAGRVTRVTWDGMVMRRNLPPKRRAVAEAFIRFVLSNAVQETIGRTGRAVPARMEAMSAFVAAGEHPARVPFVEALAYSRMQPLMSHFGAVDRTINRHLANFVLDANASSAKAMLAKLRADPTIASAFTMTNPTSP